MNPRADADRAGRIQAARVRQTGLRLLTTSICRPTPDVLDPNIHHNNLLNSILANIAGVDDALMRDAHGFVAETNATHLFVVSSGEVDGRPIGAGANSSGKPGPMTARLSELFCQRTATTGEVVVGWLLATTSCSVNAVCLAFGG